MGQDNWQLLQGDVLERLRELPDNSVHCVVTSPPYWGLRDYGVEGQIGLEATFEEFIAKLVEVFREVRRVLRPDGTCWVNMGDAYANDGKWGGSTGGKHVEALHGNSGIGRGKKLTGLKPKDLIGQPWMLAFALRADGWWLRQDIIWAKPNPMPESVTDRCTKSHEYVFLLTKSERYFYDAEAVKEPANGWNGSEFHDGKNLIVHPNVGKNRGKGNARNFRGGVYVENETFDNDGHLDRNSRGNQPNDQGTRNKRSVWTISTEAFPEAHFATFPTELVKPCILAGSPDGGTVLDPFSGSGTTGVVALRLGRAYLGIELNPEYIAIAERRLANYHRSLPRQAKGDASKVAPLFACAV